MSRYARGGIEPSLEEMLGDPVIQAVMKRDGVTGEGVHRALSHIRTERTSPSPERAPAAK